jgi:P27 family predicted phage terminase small subunit
MPGPLRKPTELKIVEGTVRASRTNPAEPKPEMLAPDERPPAWLQGRSARRGWREALPLLAGMRVATIADRIAIGLLCDAFGRWIDARAALRRLGSTTYTTTTEAGSTLHREYPQVGQEERAWQQLLTVGRDFGLTPASRTKVSTVQPGDGGRAETILDPFEAWQARSAGGER